MPNIRERYVPHDFIGWSSDEGGIPYDAIAGLDGDSGSGQTLIPWNKTPDVVV
jgi:hypothetical protein